MNTCTPIDHPARRPTGPQPALAALGSRAARHRGPALLTLLGLLGLFGLSGPISSAHAATPAELQAGYSAQAGSPANAARGQQLFTTRQGREWSCASCHGALPTQAGKHASTGKAITALAPAFNPERFTDPAKVEKWFRRNCNDVAARECSAAEKADVMAWLLTLKP
jgi:mono/diheme cytochrome c family protein